MRAIVHDRYGPPEVLRVDEVERPVPADDEVLVRVHATTVTQTDCHMRRARPLFWRFMLGLRRPRRKILGLEFAGVVEEIGPSVTQFEVGDRVFGLRSGAHAEYVCVRESRLVARMPEGMTFEQAAGTCDGMYQARNALRAGRVDRRHATGDLRRFRLARNRGRAACIEPRRPRDGRLQRPQRRARPLARRRTR